MREIIIDGNYMKTKEKTHAYLKRKLDLSDYYGENLDALWDELSVYSEPISIKFINRDRAIDLLEDYGRALLELFKEVEDENENIKFRIKSYF